MDPRKFPTSASGECGGGHDMSDDLITGGSAAIDSTSLAPITHLVVVCGHAICTDPRHAHDESSWFLKPFQRADPSVDKASEHDVFLQHIAAGSSYLHEPSTLLVFSGGKTYSSGATAEGFSYAQVLLHNPSLQGAGTREAILDRRALAECWATDSYQNVLFSMILFWVRVGRWPEKITVITHSFKQARFLECHSDALRWPRDRIGVHGINPPFKDKELREVAGFEAMCKKQFEEDPYGAREPLAGKKRQRRWHEDAFASVLSNVSDPKVDSQLRKLLGWAGGESGHEIFPHPLPWDQTDLCEAVTKE